MLLPTLTHAKAYAELFGQDAPWRPAISEIATRHDVDGPLIRLGGSNVIFGGPNAVIKIYAPMWSEDAAIEGEALRACASRLPLAIPEPIASGTLEGWAYLVLRRLPGRPLLDGWHDLDPAARAHACQETAHLCAALHRVPTAGLRHVPSARPLLQRPIAEVCEKHRREGLDERWIDDIATLLEASDGNLDGSADVFVHADVHPEHLFVEGGRLSGLIDFADALIAPAEYELAATLALMCAPTREDPSAFVDAYGRQLDAPLRRALEVALLRQRYCALPELLHRMPEAGRPKTLEELLERCFGG